MYTELEAAKALFGWGASPGGSQKSASNGAYGSSTSTRYGEVVAVDADAGSVTVRFDDTGEEVALKTDTPLAVGDRVVVVVQGGSYLVYAAAGYNRALEGAKTDLAAQIKKEGEAIKAAAEADLKEVDDAFNAFKESHALTDSDIRSEISTAGDELKASVEGRIADLGETYAAKTEVEAGINGLRAEVSENYQSAAAAGDMEKSLSAKIEQNSTAITAEVSERTKAVSGAVSESKAYTDAQATSITSTVTNSVTAALDGKFLTKDSADTTYATKSSLSQTSSSLSASVSSALAAAQAHWATCATGASTSAKVASCTGFSLYAGAIVVVKFTYANTATPITLNVNGTGAKSVYYMDSTAMTYAQWKAGALVTFCYDGSYWRITENKAVESNMVFDSNGLTVGASTSGYRTRMNANGFYILQGNNTYLSITPLSSSKTIMIKSDNSSYWSSLSLVALDNITMSCPDTINLHGGYGVKVKTNSSYGLQKTGTPIGYYRAWYSLYSSSGTAGTITLAYSAANYDALLVIGKDPSSNYFSTILYGPSGKYCGLFGGHWAGSKLGINCATFTISGTTMRISGGGYATINGNTTASAQDTANGIKVTNVFGLDY